jgi:hypothetical protein
LKTVDFYTSAFFPQGFRLAGFIVGSFGVVLAFVQPWIGVPLIIFSLAIGFTHYRLQVDVGTRQYREYVWFLGFRIGKPEPFETIDYFFIKTSVESQTMSSGRIASTTVRKTVFDGYLRFSEHEKVHIATKDDREAILRKITPMSQALNVPIMDYTKSDS